MNTQEAFVQAILDQPDDDTLRLVFADWLDEHGQPERAEFIRVQIELQHLNVGDDRYWDLKTREEDLFIDHAAKWVQELPASLREGYPFHELLDLEHFRRGLLAELKAKAYFELEELFRVLPLQTLHLETANLPIRFLKHIFADCAWLARPWCLSVRGMDLERLSMLLAS